ncbi:MAG TPA: hypothetical protein VIF40_21295 [Methylosinus sp.]|uniref:hypothetical protein n=1 Tax=Methylosinus sp. TaxID=427 RepID=UPI002F91F2ED
MARFRARRGRRSIGVRDQIRAVDAAQKEKQLWLPVEARPDAIERRRDMLAHIRPIWAGARHFDLARGREQAVTLAADPFHDIF